MLFNTSWKSVRIIQLPRLRSIFKFDRALGCELPATSVTCTVAVYQAGRTIDSLVYIRQDRNILSIYLSTCFTAHWQKAIPFSWTQESIRTNNRKWGDDQSDKLANSRNSCWYGLFPTYICLAPHYRLQNFCKPLLWPPSGILSFQAVAVD